MLSAMRGALQCSKRALPSSVGRRFASTHTLVLMRHGQSEWNLQNRFTGWVDVKLTDKGKQEARTAGELLKKEAFFFDEAYTSVLSRAIMTCNIVLEEKEELWIPVHKDWHLNERHYGALAGLDKAETSAKHGAEQVMIWRRSYDIPPPAQDESHEHYTRDSIIYSALDREMVPLTESLKDTVNRVIPWWQAFIEPEIKAGKRLLIAAHGNSLRALVKYLDKISDDEITELNIPTGVPMVYELGPDMMPVRRNGEPEGKFSGRYLGDQDAIAKETAAVAAQATGGASH